MDYAAPINARVFFWCDSLRVKVNMNAFVYDFFSLSNEHKPRNIRSEKLKMFMLWITIIADLKSNQRIHNQLIYCVILMDFDSLRSCVSGVRSYVWLPFDRKEIMKSRLFIKMFKQMPFLVITTLLVITSQYIWFHIAVYAYDVITSNMD